MFLVIDLFGQLNCDDIDQFHSSRLLMVKWAISEFPSPLFQNESNCETFHRPLMGGLTLLVNKLLGQNSLNTYGPHNASSIVQ